MYEVNIACNGLQRYKSRAFVFPIHRYHRELERRGIDCSIYHSSIPEDITDCDFLIVHAELVRKENKLDLDDLREFQQSVDTLAYFDGRDGASDIHTEVINIVDKYVKKQLLSDRERYLEPMYCFCPYSEYYYEEHDVVSTGEDYRTAIEHKECLDKLEIGWNIGIVPKIFAPYNNIVWQWVESVPNVVYQKFPWDHLVGFSPIWKSPDKERPVDVSGRFGTEYRRETVQHHRERMVNKLPDTFDSERVGTIDYWKELRNSKILLSPFGWGEVCHRDFEGYLSGNILVKPNMDHMETWPPLFEAGQTYVDISWDMDEAKDTVDTILDQYEDYRNIAETGQNRLRKYLVGETAARSFADHFEELVYP